MDAEKILGGLIGSFFGSALSGESKGKRARAGTSAVMQRIKSGITSPQGILAAVGLAVGAYEAYSRSTDTGRDTTSASDRSFTGEGAGRSVVPPVPEGPGALPPPLPGTEVPGAAVPPPLPGSQDNEGVAAEGPAESLPPPVPVSAADASGTGPGGDRDETARLLIRAMIGAAYADGSMDGEERARILGRMEQMELDEDEKNFLLEELEHPVGIEELTRDLTDPALKKMVYGLSVAAIVEDSEAETSYLQRLASALELTQDEVRELEERFSRQ